MAKSTKKQRRNRIDAIELKAFACFGEGLMTVQDYSTISKICDRARKRNQ